MSRIGKIARRSFLVVSAAVAGGVAFGYWKYSQPYENPLLDGLDADAAAITPYVIVDGDGVTVIVPRAEMGQGVTTTLAALVAEELDIALEDIRVIHGPASVAYYNRAVFEEGIPFASVDQGWTARTVRDFLDVPAKFLGLQITGGSSSVPDAFEKMRRAGAAARAVLIAAAAERLGANADGLATGDGAVIAPDGTRLPYAALVADAVGIEPPEDPPLKPRAEWTLLGQSQMRTDMVAKCTGTAEFGIDIRLPGMRFATVRMNPHLGGALGAYDLTEAEKMRGVERIVPLSGGIGVIATNTWYAFEAARALDIEWGSAPYPESMEEHLATVDRAFETDPDSTLRDDGDVEAATSGTEIEGSYRVPYLAHATMEPMNATAWLRDGRLDIWCGTQLPTQVRAEGAKIADLPEEAVHVHTTLLGGGFGRRAEVDFVSYAVALAKEMEGTPVQTTWSREEDTGHDVYRPLAAARFRAKVADEKPVAIDLQLACPSVMESQLGRIGMPMMGPDGTIVQAAWDQPYAVPNYRVRGYRAEPLLPIGSWRSVGGSQNGFFHECMMDEIAHAAGRDPLEMRLDLIEHAPSRKVLEAVAEMSGWDGALAVGHGRGVAFVLSFGVPTAAIIEVAPSEDGLRMQKAWMAADVGIALDPRNIEAQLQSALVFGLGAAIQGEITVADGRIEQSNFHDYDPLRLDQTPPIEVRVLESGGPIRGVGEPGTPPAAPALANAVFAATGRRIRELPLGKHVPFA